MSKATKRLRGHVASYKSMSSHRENCLDVCDEAERLASELSESQEIAYRRLSELRDAEDAIVRGSAEVTRKDDALKQVVACCSMIDGSYSAWSAAKKGLESVSGSPTQELCPDCGHPRDLPSHCSDPFHTKPADDSRQKCGFNISRGDERGVFCEEPAIFEAIPVGQAEWQPLCTAHLNTVIGIDMITKHRRIDPATADQRQCQHNNPISVGTRVFCPACRKYLDND